MEKHPKQSAGRGKYIRSLLVYSDLIIINILFAITLWICRADFALMSASTLRTLWVLVNVSYIPSAIWNSSRSGGHRVILLDHVLLHSLQVVMFHALFFIALNVFLDKSQFPTDGYLVFYSMAIIVVPLWWVLSRMIIKRYRRHGGNFTRIVIVGTNSTARRLIQEMNSDMGFGYCIMGVFDDQAPAADFDAKYLGTIDSLEKYIQDNDIKEVYFTQSGAQEENLIKVIDITDRLMVRFFYVPRISRIICRGFELNTIGAVPVLTTLRNPLKNIINRSMKRTFDIAFSGVFLLFFPLIYIPVAIAIKISSPGPVFFRQERTGYRGKSFKCYKFRTMKVNANADKVQATKDDPRKTRVGNFLRHTSIDELPQFINVFLGDMSVVGPRPHMLKHTEEYSRIVDKYMVRHAVKPGITGWAQVNGYRGLTDELWKMERRVEYDVWYIENWTFLLDIKIIFRTIFNAASGEQNAF